jgi:hypothetical protein
MRCTFLLRGWEDFIDLLAIRASDEIMGPISGKIHFKNERIRSQRMGSGDKILAAKGYCP